MQREAAVDTRRTILFVEDDHDLRVLVRFALEAQGYEVYTAANGREALRLLDEMPMPSLVVADLNMPVMDGREFVERLRGKAAFASLPIVVQTSDDGPSPAGIAFRVNKPVDIRALLRIVKSHCG